MVKDSTIALGYFLDLCRILRYTLFWMEIFLLKIEFSSESEGEIWTIGDAPYPPRRT